MSDLRKRINIVYKADSYQCYISAGLVG